MSKARTLADFISDGSEFADGTISVSEVSGAAPLASPTFTGTASGTFSGPLTGAVTGNVTGDLTGDVTGNVTGNLTGNVTGDVAGDIDLSAIAATISDTAVDIFVYDTRKDSDGGAWRKRTQHTSWYNETLNTATRGSRKEFPAVAVIVVETAQVTIYDGDDPDLPMWMTATYSGNFFENTITSCFMLNGVLGVGCNGYDFYRIDFLRDEMREYQPTGQWSRGIISGRNAFATAVKDSDIGIVSRFINDVAMTVLPNAPIDAATGLPVPTIAVATGGGVSVIKDDGTVADSSETNTSTCISFGPDYTLYRELGNYFQVAANYYPSYLSDGFSRDARWTEDNAYAAGAAAPQDIAPLGNLKIATDGNDSSGFFVVDSEDKTTANVIGVDTIPSTMQQLQITSDYNTGWMNGAIKLATLSDTDATNVTGSELVTNGDFSNGTTGWTAVNANPGISVSSGQLTVDDSNDGGNNSAATQNITTEVGKKYTVSFDVVSETNGAYLYIWSNGWTASTQGDLVALQGLNAGSYSATFTATTTTTTLAFLVGGTGTAVFDNISVRLAEEDRSVNGNGLQVFGTVTKSAVSSGADLVGYSGFSTNGSYIQQPYNSGYDVGTGDYAVAIWFKNIDYGTALIGRYSTKGWLLSISSGGGGGGLVHAIYTQGFTSSGRTTVGTSTDESSKGWQQVWAIRRSGQQEIWMNGEFIGSVANTADLDDTSAVLTIGTYPHNTSTKSAGEFALARVSATAPSPEQIKKIYEDEKVLFQENAQATLYGTSDAVTALAYDDSTELLHVGTSAGRSVFQGLRRVDNTTTAVGAAISASNGLVADE